jgi:uncharacterized repeat protein (TIGR01451 family)
MKNLIIIFLFLSLGNLNAQIINIPDANFKAKLLLADVNNTIAFASNGTTSIKIDINNNGEIEASEALLAYTIDVNSSNIITLNGLENFTNLNQLFCQNNQISNLNVSSNINLFYINCNNNLLTSLDTSDITDLSFGINCNNNLLTTLNLKGIGSNFIYTFNGLTYSNNPNLEYICIRENVPALTSYILDSNISYNLPECVVNSYCSFNPGGTFYTIQGTTKYDANTNGCDSNDANYSNLKINLTDGTNSGSVIANTSGNYNLPVSTGTHTLTPVLENPTYFVVAPSSATVSFPATSSPFTQNFCVSPNGMHNDLEVNFIPITSASPGYDAIYKIKYKNKGTQAQSGVINLNFQDAVLDLVSSNPAASTTATNVLTYNFSNLQAFESREINIVFNLNSPTETPALNAGSILNFSASITGLADETPLDNVAELNQTVVNAFDPNDKICLEGTNLNPSKIGDYLHYKIRFENTGNANATNVVVKDIIDVSKFDMATLLMVATSHDCYTKISEGNKVEFIFENINLPFTANANDGYVVFKIKSKSNLVAGDQVSNLAQIYFDYNFPITTNTATSNFQTLGLNEFSSSKNFIISPNPTNSVLNISYQGLENVDTIEIIDNLGKMVYTIAALSNNDFTTTLNLPSLQSGVYVVVLKNNDKNIASEKLIIK